MHKKIIEFFSEWENLTVEEKNYQINHYWITDNAREKLKQEIINAFLKKIKNPEGIKNIHFGWTGWYSPTIIITSTKESKLRLPKTFDIFEIKETKINA